MKGLWLLGGGLMGFLYGRWKKRLEFKEMERVRQELARQAGHRAKSVAITAKSRRAAGR